MIKNNLDLKLKTQQAMVLTLAMRQALHILQLPITELAQWLQYQIEHNPLMQYDESFQEEVEELDFESQSFESLSHLDESFIQAVFPDVTKQEEPPENLAKSSVSLHDYLMEQARAAFSDPEALVHAEAVIGNLNTKGFLEGYDADPQVLRVIQTFDPPGIAARDLRECLLIQLRQQKKSGSLAYKLIESHFDDLIESRLSLIAKKLSSSLAVIQDILKKEIGCLDFYPGARFQPSITTAVIPDAVIEHTPEGWVVKINDSPLPRFLLTTSSDPHLSTFYSEGKWIETILARRAEILKKIVHFIIDKHGEYLSGASSQLNPCSLQELSRHLNLHESTITRAVKEKYLSSPRGIHALRYFFPHACTSKAKGTSAVNAKQLLRYLIDQEDKNDPLSDDALAGAMAKAGVPCARRTIAKYRHSLNIPSSHRRLGLKKMN